MITAVTPGAVSLTAPESTRAEILRNIKTVLGTTAGELVMDRSFGITPEAVDRPFLAAKALLSADIIQKIATYEPRAHVTEVTFTADVDGRLIPKVVLDIE